MSQGATVLSSYFRCNRSDLLLSLDHNDVNKFHLWYLKMEGRLQDKSYSALSILFHNLFLHFHWICWLYKFRIFEVNSIKSYDSQINVLTKWKMSVLVSVHVIMSSRNEGRKIYFGSQIQGILVLRGRKAWQSNSGHGSSSVWLRLITSCWSRKQRACMLKYYICVCMCIMHSLNCLLYAYHASLLNEAPTAFWSRTTNWGPGVHDMGSFLGEHFRI